MPSRPANPSMPIKSSNLHEPFSLPGEKVTNHSHFPRRPPCSSFACKNVLKLSSVFLTSYEPLTITSRGIPGNKSVLLLHHPPFTFLICFFHAGSLQESLIYSWIPGTWELRKALLCGRQLQIWHSRRRGNQMGPSINRLVRVIMEPPCLFKWPRSCNPCWALGLSGCRLFAFSQTLPFYRPVEPKITRLLNSSGCLLSGYTLYFWSPNPS